MSLFEAGEGFECKPIPGRPKIELDRNQRQKLDRMINNKVFCGYRAVGRKFGCDEKTAKRIVTEVGYKILTRKNCPKSTPEQAQRQKTRTRKLRYAAKGKTLVLDDESYFDLDGHSFFGGKKFACKSIENVPPEIQFRQKKKFGGKLLVWIAISAKGHSAPYFHECYGAINQKIYRDECLKRLYPFIKSHGKIQTLFWPDLASSHYAKSVLEDLERNGVHYVTKEINPPNVPQLRPIEVFWSHLKRKVYSGGFMAENRESLIKKINKELKTFGKKDFESLMKNLKSKIIKADRDGVNSVIVHS